MPVYRGLNQYSDPNFITTGRSLPYSTPPAAPAQRRAVVMIIMKVAFVHHITLQWTQDLFAPFSSANCAELV